MDVVNSIGRVTQALEDIRAGRMVILVDDEDRENEGDLVMAAETVTPEAINFMAQYGRGLICLALTEDRVAQLELPMMVGENRSSRSTAFTVSIEARRGVTTGISAADRAHTVKTAMADDARPEDLVSPGHIFPLRARSLGVLQRTGHTEGAVDLARLAGLRPGGVICEIMNDDGTMARMADLRTFAKKHGLRVLSIADLVQFRLLKEQLIRRTDSADLALPSGHTWRAHVYITPHDQREFLALALGPIDGRPTLVRMHSGSVLGDVFGVRTRGRVAMPDATSHIEAVGSGVVVFIPPARVDLRADLALRTGRNIERPRLEAGEVLREYGLGAQVLRDLGMRRIRVLTNRPRKIVGLEGFGLEVVEQVLLNERDAVDPPTLDEELGPLDEAADPAVR